MTGSPGKPSSVAPTPAGHGKRHRFTARRLRSLLLVANALLGISCRESHVALAGEPRRLVTVDAARFTGLPSLRLESLAVICPAGRFRCPSEELILGGAARDGDVALAARSGAVYLYRTGIEYREQIVFDKLQGRTRGFGGSLEPRGDTAWRMNLLDSPHRTTFDDAGHGRHADVALVRMGYAGTGAAGEYFVQLIAPGGERAGDSVVAEFQLITPRDRAGDVVARRLVRSTFQKGRDGMPLAPFFDSPPIWGVTVSGLVYFSPANEYRIELLDSAGTAVALVVDAPRRPVTEDELDAESRKFMSQMPSSGRFREAAAMDVERRRRAAPKHHPAITDIRFSADGQLLVRGDPGELDEDVRWDLFDRDLGPIGYFTLKASDRVLAFQGDSILLARSSGMRDYTVLWTRLSEPK